MSKITDIKNEEDYINTKKALKYYRPIAYICFIAGGMTVGAFIILGIIGVAISGDISSGITMGLIVAGALFFLGFVTLAARSWIETKLELWEKQHPTMWQQPQYPQPPQVYQPSPVQQQYQQQPPMQQQPSQSMMYCQSCGRAIPADAAVCPYCGDRVVKR